MNPAVLNFYTSTRITQQMIDSRRRGGGVPPLPEKPREPSRFWQRTRVWLCNLRNLPTALAVWYLSRQLQRDKAFRDAWQANIAMPIYDQTRLAGKFKEGEPIPENHVCIHMPLSQANEIADRLMKHLFDA